METAKLHRAALAAVALATLLNPLNSSMLAVALEPIGVAFGRSTAEATWLVSAFAVVSAVGQPVAGRLSDLWGARRVLFGGLVVAAAACACAPWAPTLGALVALRAVQAVGMSAGFSAGLALLRAVHGGPALPPSWLGVISGTNNATAAVGPALGGGLVAAFGWRSLFLANLPVALAAMLLLARLSRAPEAPAAPPRAAAGHALRNPRLLVVYAQFATASAAFYLVFFGFPSWLAHAHARGAGETGVVLLPLAGLGALMTPVAVRLVARAGPRASLAVGGSAVVLGAASLFLLDARASVAECLLAAALCGLPNAFTGMALQTSMTRAARAGELGAAAGWFQTARYVGLVVAGTVLAAIFRRGGATEAAIHRLAIVVGVLGCALVASAGMRRKS